MLQQWYQPKIIYSFFCSLSLSLSLIESSWITWIVKKLSSKLFRRQACDFNLNGKMSNLLPTCTLSPSQDREASLPCACDRIFWPTFYWVSSLWKIWLYLLLPFAISMDCRMISFPLGLKNLQNHIMKSLDSIFFLVLFVQSYWSIIHLQCCL